MKLNIPDRALDISNRFFKALDILKDQRRIKGLQTFTKEFGLNYGNMNTLKHNRDKRTFRVEYLAYLAEKYGGHANGYCLAPGLCLHKGIPKPKNL